MMLDLSFLCFEFLFQKKYISTIPGVKNMLTSAVLILQINHVTSLHVGCRIFVIIFISDVQLLSKYEVN